MKKEINKEKLHKQSEIFNGVRSNFQLRIKIKTFHPNPQTLGNNILKEQILKYISMKKGQKNSFKKIKRKVWQETRVKKYTLVVAWQLAPLVYLLASL